METNVPLGRVESVLSTLSYPVSRAEATDELTGVTLLLADGDVNLAEILAETPSDRFESVDDLHAELHVVLPRKAVGEPYQSEGDA